jgi:hypothetical protein
LRYSKIVSTFAAKTICVSASPLEMGSEINKETFGKIKNIMEQQKKYDVFISSKSEDYPIAREICRFLESKGYVVFFAEKSIPFGAISLLNALDITHHRPKTTFHISIKETINNYS